MQSTRDQHGRYRASTAVHRRVFVHALPISPGQSPNSALQYIVRIAGLVLLAATALLANEVAASEDLVDRGRYLTTAADCKSCHTRPDGPDFAGGRPVQSPFGTLYSRNITPDSAEGIGDYSVADLKRALREGVNRAGEHMYPACPYDSFTHILDEDIEAIHAYLQSLEPHDDVVPEHDMSFPANIRMGLALWKELALDPVRFEADPEQNDQYNRGAYLVEAFGHCQSCHTPRDITMSTIDEKAYTGAIIDNWYAPNISSGPMSAIDDWSVEDLATFLQSGTNDTNTAVAGKMSEVVHESLALLETRDVEAMAYYLKNMPPPAESPPLPEPVAGFSEADREEGQALYAENCLGCHQAKGLGVQGGAPALAGNGSVEGKQPNNIIQLLLQGHAPEGTWGAMPSFATSLSDQEIAKVTNYVRTAWGNRGVPNASASLVADLRAAAKLPEGGQQAGINCPVITAERLEPVVDVPYEDLQEAKGDQAMLEALVADYQQERAEDADRDVIQAFSTQYCRQLATETTLSGPERSARLSSFANAVARVLVTGDEG